MSWQLCKTTQRLVVYVESGMCAGPGCGLGDVEKTCEYQVELKERGCSSKLTLKKLLTFLVKAV